MTKCPSRKRQFTKHCPDKHLGFTIIISSSDIWFERGCYEPHPEFDWLHQNVRTEWYFSSASTFNYALEDNDHRDHSIFMFADEADAVLFKMAYGGHLLSDAVVTAYESERTIMRQLSAISDLSREQRRHSFPGLDEILMRKGRLG